MGKNRGKILRPKYNKAGESNIPEGLHNSRPRSSEEEGYDDNAPITLTPVVVPRRVGGDLSFIRFADTIEDSSVAVIFECKYNFNIAEYPPYLQNTLYLVLFILIPHSYTVPCSL